MYTPKQTSITICIKDDQILLMRRVKNGQEYYVCPGGGRDEGETLEQTVVREIQEETTLTVEPVRLAYKVTWSHGDENYYYICKYISGEPHLPEDSEEYGQMQTENTVYDPRCVNVSRLPDLLVFPLEVRDVLIDDIEQGFKDIPRELYIDRENRRKSL